MLDLNQKNTWIIVEEKLTGTKNQCLAVSLQLGIENPRIINAELKFPWKQISPYILPDCSFMFKKNNLFEPYPNLIIAAGRKSIAIARYIKKESPKTFVCFLQNPKTNNHNFDLIAAPEHDDIHGSNIISTLGTPNLIADKLIEEESNIYVDKVNNLSDNKIAFIIGGNSKTHKMTESITNKICDDIISLSNNYGVMITTSRRTGNKNNKIIKDRLSNIENIFLWDGENENPYFSFLYHADYIVVTNDSASMISEAASTGKPVYLYPLEGGSKKFNRLYSNFKNSGAVRDFSKNIEKFNYPKLNDAKTISDEIKKKLNYP